MWGRHGTCFYLRLRRIAITSLYPKIFRWIHDFFFSMPYVNCYILFLDGHSIKLVIQGKQLISHRLGVINSSPIQWFKKTFFPSFSLANICQISYLWHLHIMSILWNFVSDIFVTRERKLCIKEMHSSVQFLLYFLTFTR